MDSYTESRGVRITAGKDLVRIEFTEQLPDRPLLVEIDYQKMRQCTNWVNPRSLPFKVVPPLGSDMDCTRCDVRVKDGDFVLCEYRGGQDNIYVQCGRDKCYACKDSKLFPGRMWAGKDHLGQDRWVTCPVCNGEAVVPRYKVLDPATGLEIDYEQQGGRLAAVTP